MTRSRIAFLIGLLSVLGLAAAAALGPQLFLASDRCQACHNGLVTSRGEDVSIGADWRASMMANAARDPYWQAAVRRETLAHPAIAAEIENECAACHMPMARYQAKAGGGLGRVFAHLPAIPQAAPEAALALDGVSCTLCHQIGPDKLGENESFSGGFSVAAATPQGPRRIFGPFDVDPGRQRVMRTSSGFVPEKADHVRSAELCATCHTLFTRVYDDTGRDVGGFPEQVPFLEWKHSAYGGEQDCQSCHMPQVEGETPISSTLGRPREGFSRHVFRGGNFFMARMLNRHRDELGVAAEPLEMITMASRTADHLQGSSAELAVRGARIEDGTLRAEVAVINQAGHKLPTAYPSRRAWVRLTVADGSGAVIFESGRLRDDGSIAGNDNDRDATLFEPHHAEIRSPEDVPIYESIPGTPDGRVTTVLLAASQYLKDNRLLPLGFDKTTAAPDIAVRGGARDDPDFRAGGDQIRYAVPVGGASGPFKVRAELWYQPIGFRWAHNIEDRPSDEAGRFLSYFRGMSASSGIVLARSEAIVK